MAHNIGTTADGRHSFAALGSRKNWWHHFGQEKKSGQSIASWAHDAGLDWHAIKVSAFADFSHPELAALNLGMVAVDGTRFIVRGDNGHILAPRSVSKIYQPHQPVQLLEWADQYASVDDRFEIDTAGCLKQGEIIFITLRYRDELIVGGDKHKAHLLATTTFDGSGATINKAVATRVVCSNTLDSALAEKGCEVRTRHNTKFDKYAVGRELATIVKGFTAYKNMGDAMVQTHLTKDQISRLFKTCLDIPFDAPRTDISSRKMNQFEDLGKAYAATVREGTEPGTAWAALNAVTRYVDHSKGPDGADEKRFLSAQFGSGSVMKATAVSFLDDLTDGALLKAVAAKTAATADVGAILKQPFRPSLSA